MNKEFEWLHRQLDRDVSRQSRLGKVYDIHERLDQLILRRRFRVIRGGHHPSEASDEPVRHVQSAHE